MKADFWLGFLGKRRFSI